MTAQCHYQATRTVLLIAAALGTAVASRWSALRSAVASLWPAVPAAARRAAISTPLRTAIAAPLRTAIPAATALRAAVAACDIVYRKLCSAQDLKTGKNPISFLRQLSMMLRQTLHSSDVDRRPILSGRGLLRVYNDRYIIRLTLVKPGQQCDSQRKLRCHNRRHRGTQPKRPVHTSTAVALLRRVAVVTVAAVLRRNM